ALCGGSAGPLGAINDGLRAGANGYPSDMASTSASDPFRAHTKISTARGERVVYRLDAVLGAAQAASLPYSIKVLLEACLRNVDGFVVEESHVKRLAPSNRAHVGGG